MTAEERALTEAEVAATAAGSAFCTASTTYIPAIDRYGDVLNATAPTAGDVKDAGSDLEQPGKGAEQAAPSSASPSPSPSSTPVSVTAVQTAEAEFAAEQLNAATVESHTATLQQALADAGYSKGKVYGPETVAAVQALQKANGLLQTGTLDKASEEALRSELAAKGGAAAQEETASTAAVQQTLKLAGCWDGPVDGEWTDAPTDSPEQLQKDLGVPVTGTVDAATIAAFEKAVADAGTSPSPSRSVSAPPGPTESS